MVIEKAEILNFRNIARASLHPSPGVNVFTGDNAQGKSSMLEALALLSNGRSFRTRRDSEMISHGSDFSSVSAEMSDGMTSYEIRATIARRGDGAAKNMFLGEKRIGSLSEFVGKIGNTVFSGGDVLIITGPPSERRSFADRMLSSSSREYMQTLRGLSELLRQKNSMLRAGSFSAGLMDVLNEQIGYRAAYVSAARGRAAEMLSEKASEIYGSLFGGGEDLSVSYAPDIPVSGTCREESGRGILAALQAALPEERRAGTALRGPQRDDFSISLGGRSARTSASRGQQRLAAMSLKLAEGLILAEKLEAEPIIFMDDCFSELDEKRQGRLMEHLSGRGQVFLTSTTLPRDCRGAEEHRVENGETT